MTRLKWLSHSLSWGVPVLVLVVTLVRNRYGYNNSLSESQIWWCWVKVKKHETYPETLLPLFWQLFTGKFWEINSYIIVVVLYSLVRYKIRQHVSYLSNAESLYHHEDKTWVCYCCAPSLYVFSLSLWLIKSNQIFSFWLSAHFDREGNSRCLAEVLCPLECRTDKK